MQPTSIRFGPVGVFARRVDWAAAAIWALGFGLVVFLGLEGGGYDALVHDRVGIALWWVLLVGVLLGALPRRRPPAMALAGLALLAGFVVWTAIGLSWTESVERTWADLARIAGYLAVFALAVAALRHRDARTLIAAVGAGIAVIALVALLSRLHPSWFPAAGETARFVSSGRERLSYPLQYWNALAALIAIGAPLLLAVASEARSTLARGAAAAALPAMALAAYLTLSRGGIAAGLIAVAAFLVLAPDRLAKLPAAALAGGGGAILIVSASGRDALRDGLTNGLARDQGDELLLIVLFVCLLVGAVHAAISYGLRAGTRPGWTVVSRRPATIGAGVAVVALLVAAMALDAPGRAADGWDEFREGGGPGRGSERLGSVAGESRYQFWSAAVRENATRPLGGTGSGTFEFWWTRDGDVGEVVRDTHSLYLQTLGEVGIVGIVLLVCLLLLTLLGGGLNALRAPPPQRTYLAAAVAACLAFCMAATFDWLWQIPVLPIATLLLAAALLFAARGRDADAPMRLPLAARAGAAVVAIAAIATIAIPLTSTALVRESEAEARAGALGAALDAAEEAEAAQPSAATPRLQQALVLEQLGEYPAAAAAARSAAAREPTNWRHWLVLARVEAQAGRPSAAVAAQRRVQSLHPNLSLLQP